MLIYRPTTQNLLGGLPFRQGTDRSPDTIIFTALENQDRNLDRACVYGTVTAVDVELVFMLGISSYLADYPVRIDLRGLRQRGLQKARKRGHRRVSDYSANAFIEALLLCRKKACRRTGASSDQIYPAVITETSLSKFEPCIQVDALHKTPGEVLATAHAVTSHMRYENMALNLFHEEFCICRDFCRLFVICVDKYYHVAASGFRGRPVIRGEPCSVERAHPDVYPLSPEGIKPVAAPAGYGRTVKLRRCPVDLWLRLGARIDALIKPFAIDEKIRKSARGNQNHDEHG